MKNQLISFAAILFLSFSSCDLNDDKKEEPTFSLYFKAAIDGVDWAASPDHIGASLDNNGASPLVVIHGDLTNTNDYFIIKFPPMQTNDTTIVSSGMAGIMEFHRNSQVWTSVNGAGNLTIHKDGTVTKQQYSGKFSGSFYNSTTPSTLTITNGDYMAQGVF
jgi:hypothetical protein